MITLPLLTFDKVKFDINCGYDFAQINILMIYHFCNVYYHFKKCLVIDQ